MFTAISALSSRLPTKPESVPTTMPNATASPAAANATSSEMRAPASVRENTSRPMRSVPKRCSHDGGCSAAAGLGVVGLGIGSHGASSASTMIGTSTARPSPSVPIRSLRSSRLPRPGAAGAPSTAGWLWSARCRALPDRTLADRALSNPALSSRDGIPAMV